MVTFNHFSIFRTGLPVCLLLNLEIPLSYQNIQIKFYTLFNGRHFEIILNNDFSLVISGLNSDFLNNKK